MLDATTNQLASQLTNQPNRAVILVTHTQYAQLINKFTAFYGTFKVNEGRPGLVVTYFTIFSFYV